MQTTGVCHRPRLRLSPRADYPPPEPWARRSSARWRDGPLRAAPAV